ncbi:MAG: ribose-phosphate pyrophosphokinase [Candidatus Dadabacteria bacterium]|nr:MAG: ribose-phosphate pyrophosphokinase [Candidatus Dadabacteria bacterium]
MQLNRSITIFSGRSNPSFTSAICEQLGVELGRCEIIRFSDGELSVDIGDNVRGRDVFIVQSTSTPGNDHLMELLIMIDALKRASAWRITAVMPYFGYARQDRKLKPRVPITAKLVANLLTVAGAHRILTMDLHAGQIMGFFDIPVDNLMALPIMYPYLHEKYGSDNITIVSPDMGGMERARLFATRLGNTGIALIDKRRVKHNEVAGMRVVGEVKDNVCIIVDDMVDTGGTLIKAAETLLDEGAKGVVAACVHPVLSANAIERLEESVIEEVVVTDTIATTAPKKGKKFKVLSVAPLFAEAINKIHNDDSVSSLFA